MKKSNFSRMPWKYALQKKHLSALELIISTDGSKLAINSSDIMELYLISERLVYKAFNEQVMISKDEIRDSGFLSKLFKNSENNKKSNFSPITYVDILTALHEMMLITKNVIKCYLK